MAGGDSKGSDERRMMEGDDGGVMQEMVKGEVMGGSGEGDDNQAMGAMVRSVSPTPPITSPQLCPPINSSITSSP